MCSLFHLFAISVRWRESDDAREITEYFLLSLQQRKGVVKFTIGFPVGKVFWGFQSATLAGTDNIEIWGERERMWGEAELWIISLLLWLRVSKSKFAVFREKLANVEESRKIGFLSCGFQHGNMNFPGEPWQTSLMLPKCNIMMSVSRSSIYGRGIMRVCWTNNMKIMSSRIWDVEYFKV